MPMAYALRPYTTSFSNFLILSFSNFINYFVSLHRFGAVFD
ncbi:hypothetical protein HMPREF9072_02395 [Capnocytophaga sp. oral taxon 324 str. F0483]|nr:hypothetical protein HMPREF9072_02395 [Capnocytophaga sp. oral taxon 324 str. F0483]